VLHDDWYNTDRDHTWQEVALGDLLLPNIYEFVTTHPITLSRISARTTRSVTTGGSQSQSNSSSLRRLLADRDASCVVTQDSPFVASHLIPRRLGSDGVRDVMERFVGPAEADRVHLYDTQIGVSLCSNLDRWVDTFQAGFYHVTVSFLLYLFIVLLILAHAAQNNTYTLHNFIANQPDMPILGQGMLAFPDLRAISPLLHGFSVTLSVHAGNEPLPPPGVFNWHYLQCVVRRFATNEYRAFFNIYFYVYSFRTASDLDDESTSDFDDMSPPYPSYHFDKFLRQQSDQIRALERHREVLQWTSGIPDEEK
jgi:hypothetical protein